MSNNVIIVIDREYGSGGKEIATKVAKKLGIKMYDRELISLIAKNSGMSEDFLHEVDETASNSLLYALSSGLFAGSALSSGMAPLPATDKAFIACSQIIKDIADKESCVILGRCAETILKGRKDLLTVFIHADVEKRIVRIAQTENVTADEAVSRIKKNDKKRAAYHNYYSDTRWGARNAYDLCLNSGIGIDVIVDIIAAAATDMAK